MSSAQAKYEKLFAVYEQFALAIADVNDPVVLAVCSSWKSAKSSYVQALGAGIRKWQIASGMEQGLREMPMVLSQVTSEKRAEVLGILRSSVAQNFPDFFKEDASLLAAIVERSKIRNAQEYFLVRYRIDELEGKESALDERNALYRLVDQFESRGGREEGQV